MGIDGGLKTSVTNSTATARIKRAGETPALRLQRQRQGANREIGVPRGGVPGRQQRGVRGGWRRNRRGGGIGLLLGRGKFLAGLRTVRFPQRLPALAGAGLQLCVANG